ncbi:hypothetical protein SKAU_G00081130 [Synaphobranchus kaupii]|uniref:Pyrin domain-containing protein n=1 Tax=Synaphobranchus kaupii TaxID=118154 RepID=A0A9Q1J3C1_SYNKA|nr:hypothetical protein SKAU_G00081130 [Synaphobranchus kaupii]
MSVPEIPEGQGSEMDESSQLERPPSPPGSYLSMESDEELPVNADEDGSTPAKVNLERTGSPETKFSEIDQYSVKPKEGTFFPKHGVHPEGEGSLETKQSRMEPYSVQTRKETVLPKHGSDAVRQPVSSRAVNSDLLALKSMVLEQGKNLCPMGMPYIFKSIQTILEIITDEELALFKKYLHRNYSQHFENQMEDSDVLDVVDKMVECCGKVGAIKTTMRTLKCMKKPDLADYLQSKCCKVLIQHDLRQHLKMKLMPDLPNLAIEAQDRTCSSLCHGVPDQRLGNMFKKAFLYL